MITIKLPYTTSNENKSIIKQMQKEASNVVRWAFNRFKENLIEKEIRLLSKKLNNIDKLDSWFIQSAILQAKTKAIKGKKLIFGGKVNFFKRVQNKISNKEWKELRILPLVSYGEACKNGNRKLKLQIIEENKIIFKPSRNIKIEIYLPKLKNNYKKQLFNIQKSCEENLQALTFTIDQKFIYLTFDEALEKSKFKNEGSYFGLDLNPNFISVVLFNKEKILQKSWSFKLKELTQQLNENKIKHELYEIAKKINGLAIENCVDFVFLEDLNICSRNHNKGKTFNKLVNNKWKRNLFINNLKKRLKISKISIFEINPAYSSFVGNLLNNYPDPVSSACEIARRGYDIIIQKTKQFYPKLCISLIKSHWKDFLLSNECKSWVELFKLVKNSRMKYRVSWSDDYVFRKFMTRKSLCNICYMRYV